jgi:outer membrane lipopolysaccharide assembly protein LptE/RlpB
MNRTQNKQLSLSLKSSNTKQTTISYLRSSNTKQTTLSYLKSSNIKHINKDFQYNIHQAVNNDENLSGQ